MSMKSELAGRQPVLVSRVSTEEQKKTLKAQVSTLEKWLKDNGITRKPKIFAAQETGTSTLPQVLEDAIAYCVERPGKTFLLVRDFQRVARNWRYGGRNMIPLYESDTPVVSALRNQVSSTVNTQRPDDWLIGLFLSIGAQEVDQIKARTAAGVAASREQGILPGATLDFYLADALNPYRELLRLLQAGIGQTETSRRLDKSTSWFRKRRDFFSLVRERGGDALVEEWLLTTDRMRERLGALGRSKEDAKKAKALKRMTSGFLKEPYNFTMPSEERLDEILDNYKLYQPKRTK